MKTRKQTQQLWHSAPSGLMIPAGTHSDYSTSLSETLIEIKHKANAIEKLYLEKKIKLPKNCGLKMLIADTQAVSDEWFLNSLGLTTPAQKLNILHLNRVADAILPLAQTLGCEKYLAALTSGNLNFFERQKSRAKDMLWELELWSFLRASSLDVKLGEPDLIIDLGNAKLSIACKKLYSDRHVQNVVSQGVAQIEGRSEWGIVAINIDDLLPSNKILQMPSDESTQEFVTRLNNLFLYLHERHFRKYLASGRLLAILASAAVVADIPTANPRLHNVRRASIWTIPGLPAHQEKLLRRFYNQLMQ